MLKFAFIWQSENLDMCIEELSAPDPVTAWKVFMDTHGEQGCIAVLSGTDLIIEDFNV